MNTIDNGASLGSTGGAPTNDQSASDASPLVPQDEIKGERRWPMATAVIVVIVLTFLLPDRVRFFPSWLAPAFAGLLLVVLLVGDTGRINRRSHVLRGISIALVALLLVGALTSTVLLIRDLVEGSSAVDSANELLATAALVWVSNNIAFALFYWELDGGGAPARAHHLPRHPDLGFPQQLNPGCGPPGWMPRFIDYLYLGFTNATAFSPTDVMPLVPWAKSSMAVQSTVSLVLVGLVVARAVNVLT